MSEMLLPAAPRFYCPNLPQPRLTERACALDAEQTRHARKVLRLKAGDRVELFDGFGNVAPAVLSDYESGSAICRVSDLIHHEPRKPRITVAAAVPKGSRSAEMVEQLSQAGADVWIPLSTDRSVVDPRDAKLERFARHAVESAKQCRRLFVMQVQQTQPFDAVVHQGADVTLFAEPEGLTPIDLPARLGKAEHVLVLIGPEGGWTMREHDVAMAAGALPWRMGANVLRIETAAVAAVSILRYLAGGKEPEGQ